MSGSFSPLLHIDPSGTPQGEDFLQLDSPYDLMKMEHWEFMDDQKAPCPNGASGACGKSPELSFHSEQDHSPEGSNIESYETYDSPHPGTPGPSGTPLHHLADGFDLFEGASDLSFRADGALSPLLPLPTVSSAPNPIMRERPAGDAFKHDLIPTSCFVKQEFMPDQRDGWLPGDGASSPHLYYSPQTPETPYHLPMPMFDSSGSAQSVFVVRERLHFIALPSRGSSSMPFCFPQGMGSPMGPHMGPHMVAHMEPTMDVQMTSSMPAQSWMLPTPLQVLPADIPTPQAGYSRMAPGSPGTSSPRGTHARTSTEDRCNSEEPDLVPVLSPSPAGHCASTGHACQRSPIKSRGSGNQLSARGRGMKPRKLYGFEEDSEGPENDANKRRKHHNPWSAEETETLVRGVETCGGGKWAEIKKLNFRAIQKRSAVDLKDKWRNLMRVAISNSGARMKCNKKREVPPELLDRVRGLVLGSAPSNNSSGRSLARLRRR